MIDEIDSNQDGINQTDYLNLFMKELTYQDPLKPVDNREFMAQMAQFSALQEARASKEYLSKLNGMVSANQMLMLMGKKVRVDDSNEFGLVTNLLFEENKTPLLVIRLNGGNVQKTLNEIREVEGA